MNFIDKAFARRLEAAEGVPQVHYAKLYQKLYPELGAAAEEICGGRMVFAGVGSPVGRTIGVGLGGPVSAAELDRVEQFYRSRQAPAQVDVCPLTDPGLLEMLKARGYVMAELNNVLYRRRLRRRRTAEWVPEIMIRPSTREQADVFADIIARSFFPQGNPPKEFHQWITPMFEFSRVVTFLAFVQGKPVACGAGLIIPEYKIFALFGDATLPEFRGRGIQRALIEARLAKMVEAGIDVAVVVTQGGSTSQRNYERAGFEVAYSKATLVKTLESDSATPSA
jgi:ribosomal protein S18 acetylase RimI-like enzyme